MKVVSLTKRGETTIVHMICDLSGDVIVRCISISMYVYIDVDVDIGMHLTYAYYVACLLRHVVLFERKMK